MRGYSQAVIESNEQAKPGLGVTLGALLISTRYPVGKVAMELEVSRQTVYDWISGKSEPRKNKIDMIMQLIDRLAVE